MATAGGIALISVGVSEKNAEQGKPIENSFLCYLYVVVSFTRNG